MVEFGGRWEEGAERDFDFDCSFANTSITFHTDTACKPTLYRCLQTEWILNDCVQEEEVKRVKGWGI